MLASLANEEQIAGRTVSGASPPTVATGMLGPVLLTPILATGIAACLRFWQLGHNSLWVDELASLVTALFPLRQIPGAALHSNAFEPPLYFWLLHGVIQVAGQSEWALRLISALAGTLTVPVVWLLVRDLSRSVPVASTTALLLAANPLHLWYSQEARPYALLICLGSAALLCLTRALEHDNKRWWMGFAVVSALAILTHVAGVVYLLIGGLWALHARGAPVLSRLAGAAAGTLLLTLPFLLTLVSAVRHATGTGAPQRPLTGLESPYTIFTFVAGYSFGPPVREIQDLGWRVALADNWGQTVLVGLLLFWITILVVRARRRGMVELAVLLIVPLAATIAGSLITTKAYNVRYTLPALVGFLGLVAVALDRLPFPARRAGVGVVLLLFGWADIQWFTSSVYWKEDSRAAAGCLTHQLPAGSTVAVAPYYMLPLLMHYAPEAAGLRFVAVADPSAMKESRPNALAITRLYHLPVIEAKLVRAFQAQTGGQIQMERTVGYRLYFASVSSGGVTGAPCRRSNLGSR
jgi:mannosyltransferase